MIAVSAALLAVIVVLIIVIVVQCVILCKMKRSGDRNAAYRATSGTSDVPVTSNEAYFSVDQLVDQGEYEHVLHNKAYTMTEK